MITDYPCQARDDFYGKKEAIPPIRACNSVILPMFWEENARKGLRRALARQSEAKAVMFWRASWDQVVQPGWIIGLRWNGWH